MTTTAANRDYVARFIPSGCRSAYHPPVLIRPETTADITAIDQVNREAFGGDQEARLVVLLREPFGRGDATLSIPNGVIRYLAVPFCFAQRARCAAAILARASFDIFRRLRVAFVATFLLPAGLPRLRPLENGEGIPLITEETAAWILA